MLERQQQRAPASHRDSLDRASCRRANDAIGLLYVRDQVFDYRVLIEDTGFRVQIKAVTARGRDDNHLADLALIAELVDGGGNSSVLELLLVAIHPMQEIKHGITPLRILLVGRWKLHGILQFLTERGRLREPYSTPVDGLACAEADDCCGAVACRGMKCAAALATRAMITDNIPTPMCISISI